MLTLLYLAECRGQQRDLGLLSPLRYGWPIGEIVEVWVIVVFVQKVVWSPTSPSTKRVLRAIPGGPRPADGRRGPGGDASVAINRSTCCVGEGGDAAWAYEPFRLQGSRGGGVKRERGSTPCLGPDDRSSPKRNTHLGYEWRVSISGPPMSIRLSGGSAVSNFPIFLGTNLRIHSPCENRPNVTDIPGTKVFQIRQNM